MKKLTTLFIAVLFTGSIFAGGFQLNEHGAKAMAMAGAFTGLANDPSAIYFNPAGITQLKGSHFYFGATMILPLATYKTPGTTNVKEYEMVGQVFSPINFYYTQELSDKLYVGLGVNNQYGLGTKWNDNWVGRYFALETEVRTFYFTPVIAYKLFDNLSVSVGAQYAFADVTIIRKSPVMNPLTGAYLTEFKANMKGTATAFGFTAGILYKASDNLQLGLSYRSQAKFEFEGDFIPDPKSLTLSPTLTIMYPTGKMTAPLTVPQNITFGFAYMPDSKVTVTADFQYVGWSTYNKLEVTATDFVFDSKGTKVMSTDRNYENTFIARAGVEYKVSDNFSLRGGIYYDRNPVPDAYVEPTLPDADRIGLNIGFGGKITEKLGVDFAYLLINFAERKVTQSKFGFNGTYQNVAHLLGLNFSYSL